VCCGFAPNSPWSQEASLHPWEFLRWIRPLISEQKSDEVMNINHGIITWIRQCTGNDRTEQFFLKKFSINFLQRVSGRVWLKLEILLPLLGLLLLPWDRRGPWDRTRWIAMLCSPSLWYYARTWFLPSTCNIAERLLLDRVHLVTNE
jgi:hypothetical protein